MGAAATSVIAISGDLAVGSAGGGPAASYSQANINFSSAKNVTVYSNGSVDFGSQAQNLNGGTLTINGGTVSGSQLYLFDPVVMTGGTYAAAGYGGDTSFTINASASTATISGVLQKSYTFNVADGAAATDLAFTGTMTNATTLTKTGAGKMVVSGSSAYTGATTVSGGTLSVTSLANGAANSPIGAATNVAGNLKLGNGTTLQYTGSGSSTDRLFTINGVAAGDSATLDASGTGAVNFTNAGSLAYGTVAQTRTLNLTGTSTAANTLSVLIGNNTTGAVSVTKSGLGTWVLSGANTYTGNTLVSAGVLALGNNQALQNSAIDTSGSGTITATGYTNPTFGGLIGSTNLGSVITTGYSAVFGITLNPGTGVTDTYSGAIADGASGMTLTKTGLGTQVLSGTNAYTGATTVSTGTLSVGASSNLGGSASNLVFNGGTLQITGNTLTNFSGIGHTVSFSAAQLVSLDVNSTTNTFTVDQVLNQTTGGFTKAGAGTAILNQANTYSGATIVSAGMLKLGAAGDGTNGPLGTVAAGTSVSATGAALDLNGFTLSTAEGLTLNGTGVSSGGALTNSSGTAATYSGLVALGSASSIVASSGDIILSNVGTISGATFGLTLGGTSTGSSIASIIGNTTGGLTKSGTGTWTLSGANTYTGATTINGGTLTISGSGTLGATTTALNLGGGTLDLGTTSRTVGAVSITAAAASGDTIKNGSLTATGYTASNTSGTVTLSASLLGTAALTKTGAGTLNLSGSNTMVGSTSLTGGTVVLDYSTNGNNKLSQNTAAAGLATALTLGGVNLQLNGGSYAQTLGTPTSLTNGTTLNAGQSKITQSGGGTSTIALGAIARAANNGGTINFGTGAATTTTGNNTGGILGGYATVNGTDWAVANGGASAITALGSYSAMTNGTLATTGNYTFTGATPLTTSASSQTVTSLKMDASANLTIGSTSLTTGGLLFTGSSPVSITGGALISGGELIIQNFGTGTLTLASSLGTGSNATSFSGTGTTVLSNAANAFTGATFLNGGIVKIAAIGSLGASTTLAITINGGTLDVTAAGITNVRPVTIAANGGTIQVDTGTLTFSSAAIISGGGVLTKTGAGTLLLQAANTYTGATTISGGTLQLGSGSTTGLLATGSAIVDNANFTINRSNAVAQGTDFSSAAITGTGSFTQAGSGTTTLSAANTYSGNTLVSAGVLALGNNLALQNSTIDTSGAGVITVTGVTTPTFGGLTGSTALASVITTGYGSVTGITLNPGVGVSNTYSGVIANGAAGMALTKSGNGTQTLGTSGSPVTQIYTGATNVTAGTLVVNGTLQTGGVTVSSGGTLKGNITAGGTTTIQSGGTLSVGNSPGTGSFATLNLAGTNIMEFLASPDRTLPGNNYDTINVSSALSYGGELRLTFAGAVTSSATAFDLFSGVTSSATDFGSVTLYKDATTQVGFLTNTSGVWTGLVDLTYGGGSQSFTFTQATGDLVVAVPEPATWGLLAFSLTTVLVFRRRRS